MFRITFIAPFLIGLIVTCRAFAAEPLVVDLWPGKTPGDVGISGEENRRIYDSPLVGPTKLITNVTKPTLTIYSPPKDKNTGTAMLILPGGGYHNLFWELEGEEVAAWLNSQGMTGIILKYRCPRRPGDVKGEPPLGPLLDAQRAVSLVRSRAKEWGIHPRRIGMVGFSAGGHLAMATATSFEKRTYEPIDASDVESCRPDFAIGCYSGYLKAKDKDEIAAGIRIPAGTPPILLAHANDDGERVGGSNAEHSAFMYVALKRAGIPVELHIYASGNHDFGVRQNDKLPASWTGLCVKWLQSLDLLMASAGDAGQLRGEAPWRKHVVQEGEHTATAVAADFTGDGKPDVISNSGGKTRLFVAPDWREVILAEGKGHDFIHSEFFDVDGDGDLDWIGARYQPGWIVWLERPAKPLEQPWTLRLVDDQLNGIHGLLKGDIDGDGRPDLIANSGQPLAPFANSAAWLRVPQKPQTAEHWDRFIFAKEDAPGLSHYFGVGDVNGDGRLDISLAAKGGPQAEPKSGEWFAWWEAPADRTRPWTKRLIAEHQVGATNIQPADVNGDGKMDFIATRGHGRGVVWFEAPKWEEHVIHDTLLEPHSLVVIDLDGDGDIDAATCAYGDRKAMWFENDGKGRFTSHLVADDQAAYDIRAVDMDLDGDLDLLIAGQASKNVVWYENPRDKGAKK